MKKKLGIGSVRSCRLKTSKKIADFQAAFKRELPGVLWTMPDIAQQHITLFEIVMTFRDYPEDRDTIFERTVPVLMLS
jgi:hypothetical protein